MKVIGPIIYNSQLMSLNVSSNPGFTSWVACKKLLSIAVFGFSLVERKLISSVCKLSQLRLQQVGSRKLPGFQTDDAEYRSNPDILLIDGDDAKAMQSGLILSSKYSSIPIIIVSKDPGKSIHATEFTMLDRRRLGSQLLKSLDRVVEIWLCNDRRTLNDRRTENRQSTSAERRKKHCLVIDDSDLVHTQMQLLLKEYPLNVHYSKTAEFALKLVGRYSFDMIFLDIMLPEMNGYEFCKLLKNNSETSDTPIVMLSSKTSAFNKVRANMVGCDKYLTKPATAEKLHQVLQQYRIVT